MNSGSADTILSSMRKDAVSIFNQGLAAVDPRTCISECCMVRKNILYVKHHAFDLTWFERIWVMGAGKAAASMAAAVEELLADRIEKGLVVVKYDHLAPLETVEIKEAAHPVPDDNSVTGAEELLSTAREADEKTLILCLISGGGSALMTLPADGISLADKQAATQVLLGCGATIHEINTIRKHLSRIKGGQLAAAAFPAAMVCLILSDVVGDDLDIIASGPAVADPSTYGHCLDVINRYQIMDRLPPAVTAHLSNGAKGLVPETPKPGDPVFERVWHAVVASNFDALIRAETEAKKRGYQTLVLSSVIEGETRDVAGVHAAVARQVISSGHPVPAPACILSGGETTVTLKGGGKGGRNQEFALAAAFGIENLSSVVVLSGGTDGTDGPTDAAGAIVDGLTLSRAEALNLDANQHLAENNAYPFFEQLEDLLKTGATNTNVMDLRIVLIR